DYISMNILALGHSTAHGSLTWLGDDDFELVREWPIDRKNSGALFENLYAVTKKLGAPETIVVGLGPGSYTGTRIAISAAIGLEATTGAGLAGISSLFALSDENDFCVVGDAKRASFFLARSCGGLLKSDPELRSEDEMNKRISSVRTIPIYTSDELPQFTSVKRRFPSAKLLCLRAQTAPQNLARAPL